MTEPAAATCATVAYHEWSIKHQLSVFASPSEDEALQEAIQTLYTTHMELVELHQQVQQIAALHTGNNNTATAADLSGSQQQGDSRCPRLLYQLQVATSQLVQGFINTITEFNAWRDYTALYLDSDCTVICKQAEEYLSRAHALHDALKEVVDFLDDSAQAETHLVSYSELDGMHPQPDHGRAHAEDSEPNQCVAHDKQKLPEINTEPLQHEEHRATTQLRIHNSHTHHSIRLVDVLRLHHEDASSEEMLPLHIVINQTLQPHEELRYVDCSKSASNVIHMHVQ